MPGVHSMSTIHASALIRSERMSINDVREILKPLHRRPSLTLMFADIVQSLQDLHDMLIDYHAPKVVHPTTSSLNSKSQSFLSALLHPRSTRQRSTEIPSNIPQGLYMFGDVGSGKTMLMDMFYDTLPHNITSKTRIHFHNFMQDVHKQLHTMKTKHGSDLDAVKFVAADIAEKGSVLCFDEFQCTDVADAMILRRFVRYRYMI